MTKKTAKTKNSVSVERLARSIDDLAQAAAKGFANSATKRDLEKFATKQDLERFATKQDLESLGSRIDNSLEDFVRNFRGDYDELAGRVKRLEVAVFKR